MTRRTWNTLIALPWVALPVVAIRYWLLWDRLPARVATHFDAAGHPNGWMSREGSLQFAIIFLAIMLAVMTGVLAYIRKPEASALALWGLFCTIVACVVYVELGILNHSLDGRPLNLGAMGISILAAVVLLVAVFIASSRGTRLPEAGVLADEVHASRLWGMVMLAPLALLLAISASAPNTGIRLTLVAAGLVMLGAAAMAWSGFHYIFTSAGLEIRTLGFRLRSIPRAEIREYAAANWSIAGGYGIRGLGNRRAYVWSNQGVRIKTSTGEVFLGHSEPQRIVRDLDLVTQAGARAESSME